MKIFKNPSLMYFHFILLMSVGAFASDIKKPPIPFQGVVDAKALDNSKKEIKEISNLMKQQKKENKEKTEESVYNQMQKFSTKDRSIAEAPLLIDSEKQEPVIIQQQDERNQESVNREPNHLVPLIRESLFDRERKRNDLDVYLTEKENHIGMGEIKQDLGDVEIRWKDSSEE